MNKICTDIEQSKKLIELGINVNTADMYWNYDIQNHKECLMVMDEQFDFICIPAWSLTALLEILPRIEGLKPFIDLSPNLSSEEVSIYYHSGDSPYIVRDNLVDAVFELVCWLLENKKL